MNKHEDPIIPPGAKAPQELETRPPSDEQCKRALLVALEKLRRAKPNDRTERDRQFAIAITQTETTLAYFDFWVINSRTRP